jgi:hypothetical protein
LRDILGKDIGQTWKTEGILQSEYINWMREEHSAGRQDLSHELFAVIAFDTWWRTYVGGGLSQDTSLTEFMPLTHGPARLSA